MYYTSINKIVYPAALFLRNNCLRETIFRIIWHTTILSFVQVYHSIKSIRDFRQVVYRKKTMPCYMEQLAYRLCKLPYNLRCIGDRFASRSRFILASGFLDLDPGDRNFTYTQLLCGLSSNTIT